MSLSLYEVRVPALIRGLTVLSERMRAIQVAVESNFAWLRTQPLLERRSKQPVRVAASRSASVAGTRRRRAA
jgi:hypothetical protein